MRRNTLVFTLLTTLVAVTLLVLLLVVAMRKRQVESVPIASDSTAPVAAAAPSAPEAPKPVDRWADRELDAVRGVQGKKVGETTVGARIREELLQRSLSLFRDAGAGEWVARRVRDGSVYAVDYRFTRDGFTFGPRWYVQLDGSEPSPPGTGGVVASGALAEFLEHPEPGKIARYLDRSPQVVDALTRHRLPGGLRLGSALLIYFNELGRERKDLALLGWAIVPDRIVFSEAGKEPSETHYDAFFRWKQGDEVREAHWEVNVQSGEFKPKNLLAGDVADRASTVKADALVDIRPRRLDLSVPPAREKNAGVRSLRHILADERLVEAVGALLAFRGRGGRLEYKEWKIEPVEGDGERFDVRYVFTDNGVEDHVGWRVDSRSGSVEPVGPIASMASQALSTRGGAGPEGGPR